MKIIKKHISTTFQLCEFADSIKATDPTISLVDIAPDWETIICLTPKEAKLYNRIMNKCGVANTEALLRALACKPIKSCAEYLRKLDRNITKRSKKISINIAEVDGYYIIEGDGFCHHNPDEAKYWFVLDNYA